MMQGSFRQCRCSELKNLVVWQLVKPVFARHVIRFDLVVDKFPFCHPTDCFFFDVLSGCRVQS